MGCNNSQYLTILAFFGKQTEPRHHTGDNNESNDITRKCMLKIAAPAPASCSWPYFKFHAECMLRGASGEFAQLSKEISLWRDRK
jgi:hypothetical protein